MSTDDIIGNIAPESAGHSPEAEAHYQRARDQIRELKSHAMSADPMLNPVVAELRLIRAQLNGRDEALTRIEELEAENKVLRDELDEAYYANCGCL